MEIVKKKYDALTDCNVAIYKRIDEINNNGQKRRSKMSKIIIYNKDNILVAELEGKIEKDKEYRVVRFKDFKLLQSISIQKQLRKIERNLKYHKKEK